MTAQDPNADFKRSLKRLLVTIAISLVLTLGLVWYLWENSPKTPLAARR
jgi:hypothetical protein